MNFYNEHDPSAAAWLRELIREGHIPNGVVDTRDIQQLTEDDLASFTQVHLFAGIGGWSLALRLAGWPDGRRVWTGSCPCQPFSDAGKRKGSKDSRHLWPWMRHLLFRWRPPIAFGEQVASGLGREWIAGVRANLETLGYAVGAADLCSAGVAAPHIRQRLFWVADAERELWRAGVVERTRLQTGDGGRLGHAVGTGLEGYAGDGDGRGEPRRDAAGTARPVAAAGAVGGVADADRPARERADLARSHAGADGRHDSGGRGDTGFWSAHDLIPCRDGKARRVEPGTFPLVTGIPPKLGRLWASCVRTANAEVTRYGASNGGGFFQNVSLVRDIFRAEAVQWPAGGCGVIPPTAFLLDFLRHLSPAGDGATLGGGGEEAGAQAAGGILRGVRGEDRVRRSSCGRRTAQQLSDEPPKSLPELSLVLARCAQTLWEAAGAEDAQAVPLSIWPVCRAGLLRGYGNAINPHLAATFVRAYIAGRDAVTPTAGGRGHLTPADAGKDTR